MLKKKKIAFNQIRQASTFILILLLLSSSVYGIGEIFDGTMIQATPFDYKLSQTGLLNGALFSRFTETESIDSLFMKARSFRYTPDLRGDHWQSPEETEVRRSGDCEDKAVWLYAQLKHNGYSDVRLVVGKYRSFDIKYHVWVSYKTGSKTAFILDPTIQKRVWKAEDFSVGFYQPAFSFDGQHRYKYYPAS